MKNPSGQSHAPLFTTYGKLQLVHYVFERHVKHSQLQLKHYPFSPKKVSGHSGIHISE